MQKRYRTVKYACYMTNVSMAAVANLSPLLFLTFREVYGISYSLLGLLVLLNFCTQLAVDLLFSFFSHRFPIQKTIRLMPAMTVVGILLYAMLPFAFPHAVYPCLAAGTVVFAASAGLAEVLISPVIAAIPSENPEREMSKLHSVYAWGVVAVVVLSTLFLFAFGKQNWQFLALAWGALPLVAFLLFLKAEIPSLETPERASSVLGLMKNKGLILCVLCIFLGGASESTMSQWSSSYLENALNLPKLWGDLFGVALFAAMLGAGRTLYAKRGKHIDRVLLAGMAGSVCCYVTAALSGNPVVGLLACVMTGLCTSMLWPGSLIAASDRFPSAGVAVYALMAAGGDLGASVAPQAVGLLTDAVAQSPRTAALLSGVQLTAEQAGMRAGLLSAALFPLLGVVVLLLLRRLSPVEKGSK